MEKEKVSLDITGFYISTDNDIVPFELEAFPDRDFFRNVGSTSRTGLETAVTVTPLNYLTVQGAYTFSDFTYEEDGTTENEIEGKALPGVPKHQASANISYNNPKIATVKLTNYWRDAFFANDNNTASEGAAWINNLHLSKPLEFDVWTVTPFFEINNIFDTEYSDNVRLNAFGGRYFEPAPGRNFHFGVRFLIN